VWGKTVGGTNSIALKGKNVSTQDSQVLIQAAGGTGADADIFLYASANNDLGANVVLRLDTADNDISLSASTVIVSNDLTVSADLVVGAANQSSLGADGTLMLNQGAADGVILDIRSSDMNYGTESGMESDNTYLQISKIHADGGGALIHTSSDYYYGTQIVSHISSANSSYAPIIFDTAIGGSTSLAATDNLLILRNGTTVLTDDRFIVKGDGDVYIKGTYETYDHLDDVMASRAVSALGNKSIREAFEENVLMNFTELEAEGLVETRGDGYMVNTTGMMRLHQGALWQLHERIEELEAKIGRIH
jgi:hypothetical protein